ncbi:type 1 fimbria pilin [Buttiauxella sp. BIGb0471]|uniref:fimbrial protein n=1 Tax=Buttiauxella sp. BIGb0471 TaxID=2940597 RepID=UPI002167A9A7|nr:fimbrial protein [Buttiauxella sp. BIGb0471]MCS3601668.1 type 1 fimbria pilin [Buttiauxella sp. BIGb0471]
MKASIDFPHLNKSHWPRVIRGVLRQAILVALFLIALTTGYTQAACPVIYNATPPADLNIDPSLPVGSVLATMQLSWPLQNGCQVNGSGAGFHVGQYGNGVPNGNLYPTGLAGVSYRGKIEGWYNSAYWPTVYDTSAVQMTAIGSGTATIEFVKTGPVEAGILPPMDYLRVQATDVSGTPDATMLIIRTGVPIPVDPVINSCSATPVVPVSLNTVLNDDLATVGATAGDKTFNINVTCTGPANISLMFTGDVVDSNNAVFRNSDAITGSTIGIQILNNNSAVPIGAGRYMNLNVVNGTVSPTFTARYYAFAQPVIAGNVNAIAYATIVYN